MNNNVKGNLDGAIDEGKWGQNGIVYLITFWYKLLKIYTLGLKLIDIYLYNICNGL